MCFSATASFAVGAGLIAPSYYSISKTESRQMLMLASTPVVFSALQISEGFLWLSLQHHDYASWYKPSLYSYSFISQAVWPAWTTLAVWMMEPDKRRKKILNYFVLLGIASSLYMIYCLLTSNISAAAEHGHIRYYREFPFLNATRVVNFITMAVTPFFSSLRYMKIFATGLMALLLMAYFFYTNYLISVWCFFASILSIMIILIIKYNNPSAIQPALK